MCTFRCGYRLFFNQIDITVHGCELTNVNAVFNDLSNIQSESDYLVSTLDIFHHFITINKFSCVLFVFSDTLTPLRFTLGLFNQKFPRRQ